MVCSVRKFLDSNFLFNFLDFILSRAVLKKYKYNLKKDENLGDTEKI